jgi:hypothetical protein
MKKGKSYPTGKPTQRKITSTLSRKLTVPVSKTPNPRALVKKAINVDLKDSCCVLSSQDTTDESQKPKDLKHKHKGCVERRNKTLKTYETRAGSPQLAPSPKA